MTITARRFGRATLWGQVRIAALAIRGFDAIELCHFWSRFLNPNRRTQEVAARFQKPLIATSDAHQLHAFGSNV